MPIGRWNRLTVKKRCVFCGRHLSTVALRSRIVIKRKIMGHVRTNVIDFHWACFKRAANKGNLLIFLEEK